MKVLLSKADLLAPSDLESALTYIAGQIRARLGVDLAVHPVSTAASHAHNLEQWFSSEIAPLYQRHRQLAQESCVRKTGALREAVEAALRARLNRTGAAPALQREQLLTLERDLREAAGKLEGARTFCLRLSEEIRSLTPAALDEAATALLAFWTGAAGDGTTPETAVTTAIATTAGLATRAHTHLHDLARNLAAALRRTATALGSNDAPEEEELLQPLREMPRFDPPAISLRLHRPWIRYPQALARSRIRSQLEPVLEQPLSEAFASHGRVVEDWSLRALAELQLAFDSSADAYRAQLARFGAAGSEEPEELAILDDLSRLSEMGVTVDG